MQNGKWRHPAPALAEADKAMSKKIITKYPDEYIASYIAPKRVVTITYRRDGKYILEECDPYGSLGRFLISTHDTEKEARAVAHKLVHNSDEYTEIEKGEVSYRIEAHNTYYKVTQFLPDATDWEDVGLFPNREDALIWVNGQ